MLYDMNSTALFHEYYAQWIEVYKKGAIREATLAKYLMTQKWVEKLIPEVKVSELTRTAYQQLLNEYAKEHERLVPIEGTPVDMLNPPKGCPFAPRCEACMKICLREMPPVTNFGEVHYTQCWLNQKEEMEKGAAK